MRLGARTTVWALLLCSVPLLGMAIFTFQSARQTLHTTVERQLLSAAQSSLASLYDTILNATNDVVSWSSLLVVQDVLTDDESGDTGRELTRLVQQYPQFSELAAVNEHGIVIAATRPGDVGLDLTQYPAWQAGQRGHTYRGHVGDTPLAARQGLVLAAPIRADYDRDTVIGTLVGVVDWERLRAHLHDQTLLGEPQDRTRYLVVRDASVTTPLFDAYGDDGTGLAGWPETPGISHAEADGQRFIVGTAVNDDGHGQRLLVHTLLAAAVADAGAYALRDRYAAFGLLILLAAVAAGLAFARSLTRPIVALQAAARRLAQRDFDTPLPAAGRDELGSLTRSFAAMRTAMKSHEAERSETEEKIRRLAYFDQLTGLPNRAFLDEHLRASLQSASRRGTHVAVIYFDLDHFKRVNDTLGHGAGDILLTQAAERLRHSLRGSDCITREPEHGAPGNDAVVRFGGDEFIIVLGDVHDAYGVARVARRLLDAFAPSFKLGSDELFVTCSIGIAMYPDDGHDAESLLRNADAAMYDAKQHGRNGYSFYLKEMNARARERLTLEGRLRRAIEREQFELHYQPQIDLRNNRIIGLEALVRWADPEKGLVSPAEFIPLAEETGLILPLGEWILKRACAQMQAWRGTALDCARVAVNLSLRQVKEKNFARVVEETLAAHGLGADRIELELTESVLMEDSDGSSEILAKLKSLGLRLSIDDFGTGYSSLSYLKRFAIDSLKIDRSFVRDIESDPNDQAIITAVIAMAHKLNLEVIAEGVETVDQARLLRQLGCDQIQGFWISRPLPAVDIERFARSPIAVLDELPAPATTALLSLRGSARAG